MSANLTLQLAELQPVSVQYKDPVPTPPVASKAVREPARKEPLVSFAAFEETVREAFNALGYGWYSGERGCVLPPHRAIVPLNVAVCSKNPTVPSNVMGFWFLPQVYEKSLLSLSGWCNVIQWKSINGYGVDCAAWHKVAEAADAQVLLLSDVVIAMCGEAAKYDY